MKKFTQCLITLISLFSIQNNLFAQAPNLGSAADFVLFTSIGAVTNTGISQITGHVGSNIGAGTGFGNVNGVMHSGNGATGQATADLNTAYNQLNAAIPTNFVAPLIGNGDTLIPGVYNITGVTTLNGNLILNGQGDPNAVFIFQIQAAFSSNALAKVILINGALACNVFWKVEGLVDLASGTYFRGTIVAHNAGINMNALDTLEGRALSTTGAISINGTMAYTPIGCGSPTLTGPSIPSLGSSACYALFTSNGALTNAGITQVTGDVGTNVGLTTGFNPLFVNGAIHPIPDGSTAAAAADLLNAANLMNIMPYDIELLYPAQFGLDLVLTPHSYIMNSATTFTGNVYLNAQGNTDAVFLIKIYGALTTSTFSHVILTNGTQADHVFWLVSGAVGINDYSIFNGTIISRDGAISLTTGVELNGRALTTDGAFSTVAISAMPISPCFILPLNWLYFNGQAKNNNVRLTWGTSNEVNNDYFRLEKSNDGLSFETLTIVMVDDELAHLNNDYEFVDYQPFYTTYYRISQTDIDGQTKYYKTICVKSTPSDNLIVTHNALGDYIEVRVTNAEVGKGFIELFTMEGKGVQCKEILLNQDENQYQLNKPTTKGLYFLRIMKGGEAIYNGKILVN